MKRFLTVVLTGLLLFASAAFARPDHSVVRDYARLLVLNKPTFVRDTFTPVGSGSAIVIAPGYALSAWHVFATAQRYNNVVTLIEGSREIRVTVVKKNEEHDIALITGDFNCPCAPIATALPDVDEQVAVVGYPLYSVYRLQFVSVGTYQGIPHDRNKIAMNAHAAPGSSGGGVFYKENGVWKLFGILESIGFIPLGPRQLEIEQQLNWLTFAVPLASIRELLKDTNVTTR